MNDERNAQQPEDAATPWNDDETADGSEDLLADLTDVGAGRDEALPEAMENGGAYGDDLDAFLDEFESERAADTDSSSDERLGEVAGSAGGGKEQQADEDFDVLNLSDTVTTGEESFAPWDGADEGEHEAESRAERHQPGDEPFEEPVAAQPAAESGGRRSALGALAILVALGAAGGAAFMSLQTQERIGDLQTAMANAGNVPMAAASDDGVRAMDAVRRLAQRVEELALIIEGPMSHVRETSERELENIVLRIDTLEDELTLLRQNVAAAAKATPAPPPSRPASAKATPADGNWAVNLASYTREDVADAAMARLRKSGIDAVKQVTQAKGSTWYRLRVTGFADKPTAEAFAERIKKETEWKETWVVEQ